MIRENISLLPYNTFGIDVKTRYFATFGSLAELHGLCGQITASGLPYLVIGGGSNLLFTHDFDGWIIKSDMQGIRVLETDAGSCLIEVDAGVVWDDFVAYCVQHQLYGAENLSLIPGTTGASAVQNIGAYGAEAKDIIETVNCMEINTGNIFCFRNEELQYGYRTSRFKTEWQGRFAITSVRYRLSRIPKLNLDYKGLCEAVEQQDNPDRLAAVRQAVISIRCAKLPDPAETGNAGSFFMNPVIPKTHFERLQAQYPAIPHYLLPDGQVKIPAAWLIEQCGWKGKTLGKAGVHPKQPLVLINTGGACGTDIAALADRIINDVYGQFDIKLHPEVIFL